MVQFLCPAALSVANQCYRHRWTSSFPQQTPDLLLTSKTSHCDHSSLRLVPCTTNSFIVYCTVLYCKFGNKPAAGTAFQSIFTQCCLREKEIPYSASIIAVNATHTLNKVHTTLVPSHRWLTGRASD